MSSTVYCIHHKQGCKWTDELRKLKAHLNTCKYDAMPCSNNCGSQIPRVLMEDHLKYTCSQRRTRCEFCGKDFTGVTLEVSILSKNAEFNECCEKPISFLFQIHLGNCSYEPIYCENKCGHKVQRRLLQQHKAAECSKRLVPCRYCTHEFIADTLQASFIYKRGWKYFMACASDGYLRFRTAAHYTPVMHFRSIRTTYLDLQPVKFWAGRQLMVFIGITEKKSFIKSVSMIYFVTFCRRRKLQNFYQYHLQS